MPFNTLLNRLWELATLGSRGPMIRNAILSTATDVTGLRCLMIRLVPSSHSWGRLLKKEWSKDTILPGNQKEESYYWIIVGKEKYFTYFEEENHNYYKHFTITWLWLSEVFKHFFSLLGNTMWKEMQVSKIWFEKAYFKHLEIREYSKWVFKGAFVFSIKKILI